MGISKRDYFAGLAMQAFINLKGHTCEHITTENMVEISDMSVEMADFMVNETDEDDK